MKDFYSGYQAGASSDTAYDFCFEPEIDPGTLPDLNPCPLPEWHPLPEPLPLPDPDCDCPLPEPLPLPDPDCLIPEPEPDCPIPEPEPDCPIPEPEPDCPIPEPEPDCPVPEPEPDCPIPEPEPDCPVPEPCPPCLEPDWGWDCAIPYHNVGADLQSNGSQDNGIVINDLFAVNTHNIGDLVFTESNTTWDNVAADFTAGGYGVDSGYAAGQDQIQQQTQNQGII
ncbi:hypothetical protein [Neisseria animaloris]|uniref:hypothetical protein n=1 Tax=Neisseria animaloris TaxID=326522 RepID=UPI0039DFE930